MTGRAQPRGVGDGRHVQQQVRGSAKRGVHGHRVADGAVGEHVARRDAGADHLRGRARRAARDVGPDRLPRRRQRRMRHGEAERLGHHLRGRRRAEELAAAAGRRARAASEFGGLLERELPVGVARADGLHRAGIDAVGGRQRDAAGHGDGRHVVTRGQRHQHRRQALVAGRDANHRAARGQRSDQPPQHQRRVVAIRQAVHHAGGALRAAVARVGDKAGKRQQARPCAASRPPRAPAARLPSGPCDSPGPAACRRARARRPACSGSAPRAASAPPAASPCRRPASSRRCRRWRDAAGRRA